MSDLRTRRRADQHAGSVDVHRMRSAEALLHELDSMPHDAIYEDPEEWIFRGVGSNAYPLLPSALRDDTYLGLGGTWKRRRSWPAREAVLAEAYMLQMYLQALLRAGLTVPGGDEVCRLTLRTVLREALTSHGRPGDGAKRQVSWPADALLPLLGLAQHHGLPTRLLDFTWDARVAAYFAATDALQEGSEFLSVWAVHASRLELDVELRARIRDGGASTTDPGARLVFVDSSFNPRLRAQRGLFLFADAYRQALPEQGRATTWHPIERLHVPAFDSKSLRRYDLHRRHAPALLARLARVGVDGGAIYPDHAGAWASVQERLQLGQRSLKRYRTHERRLMRHWQVGELGK